MQALIKRVLVVLIFITGFYTHSFAAEVDLKLGARVRSTTLTNNNFSEVNDSKSYTSSRFRVNMSVDVDEKTRIFFQPQFTEVWGDSLSTMVEDTHSVHQALIRHQFNEKVFLQLGKQEINFGDQLVVGAVGYHNVGRTFDAAVLNVKFGKGNVDVFTAKISDSTVDATESNQDFYGFYTKLNLGEKLSALDIYYLVDNNSGTSTMTSSAGVRAKSNVGERFDYRIELVSQNVDTGTSSSESLVDAEIGYIIKPAHKLRVGLGVSQASKGYNQLYPTAHKWLGYADQFSRKNLSSVNLNFKSKISEHYNLRAAYHIFQRSDDSTGAFNFSGTSFGTVGTEKAVASEVDIVVSRNLSAATNVELGLSSFAPSEYLKDQGAEDTGAFGYLQISATY